MPADALHNRQPNRDADRLKIIVGVDYGTTFTGVSYVTSDKTSIDDIDVFRTWPGDGRPVEGNWKTPTVIAYGAENGKGSRNRWGYEVRRGMEACSWTKLLLDTSAETAEFDDPSLREAAGSAFFRLPPGKDAKAVCQDFLSEVYRFVVHNLEMRMTPEIFNMTPMECYLTIPAIWTDKARSATRDAAKAAGFGSRPFDTICMIAEPEAAAIAALRKDLRPGSVNAVKAGDNILIADCGGGTVDITTYTVRKTFPALEFDEICVGTGGKCGSTYIDRNFLALMSKRFGKSFDDVPLKRKGPGSEFMASFERAKQSFGTAGFGTSGDESFEIYPIDMQGSLNPDHYDEDEAAVILSKGDMEEVFDLVVKDVLRLVSQQVKIALDTRDKRINLIVLAGGFGNSDYLKRKLDEWCATNGGIKCIRPDFCQASVVRGAAIRGLEKTIPATLICRRHYGFSWGLPFVPGRDDEKNAFFKWGVKYCRGHMNWMIAKGAELTASTYKTANVRRIWLQGDSYLLTLELYSCALDIPAARLEHEGVVRVGTIRLDFTNVDMSRFEQRQGDFGTEFDLEYQIGVKFRSDEGVLKCFCLSEGRLIGDATISFTEIAGYG
ncbi:Heat shock protein SSA3 [Madurella mycetomatis]|uniref:Heat shock protein SSA3 n=1 Tax=Madurella mycetomatis TaxID=100816 RepID=A0A175VPD0_9PEZI|nr:Heat shock protein SSA3 [Madurella mycetomatis]